MCCRASKVPSNCSFCTVKYVNIKTTQNLEISLNSLIISHRYIFGKSLRQQYTGMIVEVLKFLTIFKNQWNLVVFLVPDIDLTERKFSTAIYLVLDAKSCCSNITKRLIITNILFTSLTNIQLTFKLREKNNLHVLWPWLFQINAHACKLRQRKCRLISSWAIHLTVRDKHMMHFFRLKKLCLYFLLTELNEIRTRFANWRLTPHSFFFHTAVLPLFLLCFLFRLLPPSTASLITFRQI